MAESMHDLTGKLLVAHPSLRDPNFRRTVVLLCQHDAEEGTFGFIMNRQLEQTAADFLPDEEVPALAQVAAFEGGPVATNRLVFTDFQFDTAKGHAQVRHALGIEEAQELVQADQAAGLRAFVGYSGWSEGQLEEEIAQGAWIIAPPVAESFAIGQCSRLWARTLKRLGGKYALLAALPEDPSKN
ncbi:MAG: YqgE/AlgH family protein [Verrucomicrobia bacterium]|nr:YqgE/AlgH family protein [Verrucomicrobiota bacterium]